MEGSELRGLSSTAAFLSKTYDMVDNPATDEAVSWSKSNNSFIVWSVQEFARDLLPKYFKHSNFSSFVRQLNTYGFRKVDPDKWEFANEGFIRGQKHLLANIQRRKPAYAQAHGRHQQPSQPQLQSAATGSCIEVGKFGMEEEVERLKRDKNVLMQELVKLQQLQQSTDHQILAVGQRVQVMEQRQQQMMSFLARAMRSPGSVAQCVQQQSESNRHISNGNKKRRIPNQDEENFSQQDSISSSDGHIAKYQPLINEVAKAIRRQILKINASGRFESKARNLNSFLIDDALPSANVLDSSSSSDNISGVTLSEVFPSSAVASDIHSSPDMEQDKAQGTEYTETNVPPDFVFTRGIIPVENAGFVDEPLKKVSAPVVSDEISPDSNVGMTDLRRLLRINYAFWEQFLPDSPFTGDTDESSSISLECAARMDHQTNQQGEQDEMKQLSNLTQQMELLTPATTHNIEWHNS